MTMKDGEKSEVTMQVVISRCWAGRFFGKLIVKGDNLSVFDERRLHDKPENVVSALRDKAEAEGIIVPEDVEVKKAW